MLVVKEVVNRKMQRDFLNFPLKLYKNNKYFVPPIYADEKTIFTKKNIYHETCENAFFNAYLDGKMVGRINAFIQNQANEKNGTKRARFTRFDAINDVKVAKALFHAAEQWAQSKGMDTVCGPLGYSDMEREGLLIEGFDYLSTFEEQYNYDYYQSLIEACGYEKEVDWVEYRLFTPKEKNAKLQRLSDHVLERNKLNLGKTFKNKSAFIDHYKDQIFDLLDETYKKLYGTVPFTEKMKNQMIMQFKLILDLRYIGVVCDENDRVVAFGLTFPAIGEALQKRGGKLTIGTLIRLLKIIKKPKSLDFGLIGVLPEYQGTGVNAILLNSMINSMIDSNVQYAETNLNLEDNERVQSQWKFFEHIMHKRRRSFVKKII